MSNCDSSISISNNELEKEYVRKEIDNFTYKHNNHQKQIKPHAKSIKRNRISKKILRHLALFLHITSKAIIQIAKSY
jgi:hypothetical protein